MTSINQSSIEPGIFPEPVLNLPQADVPVQGVRAFLSQSSNHQILFMEFAEDVEVPEHAHESQWGVVLAGQIDLTIGSVRSSYRKGETYFIPTGVKHSAHIRAGYADITMFGSPNRYKPKTQSEVNAS